MTHPTIKLLEELEQHVCPDGGNVFADCLVEDEEFFQIKNLSEAQYDLLRECLRTLIGKHEDVEGDEYRLPKEVFVTAEGWDSFFECTSAYRDKRAKNVPSAPYHRADTIVNEITRRIEDG